MDSSLFIHEKRLSSDTAFQQGRRSIISCLLSIISMISIRILFM